MRLGELHTRSSSEPLRHLDKSVIELRIHRRFNNLTKEFDIALIKFDEKGIEFQVFLSSSLLKAEIKLSLIFAAPHPADLSASTRRGPGRLPGLGDWLGQSPEGAEVDV